MRTVLVSGRVQGVGFRWAARAEAERLDVAGTIENLADGRVQARLVGADEPIQRMTDWLRHGPPLAAVDAIDTAEESDPPTAPIGFAIL